MSTESGSSTPTTDDHILSSDRTLLDENAHGGNILDPGRRQETSLVMNDLVSPLLKPGILDERNIYLPTAQAHEFVAAYANEANEKLKRKNKELMSMKKKIKELVAREKTLQEIIEQCDQQKTELIDQLEQKKEALVATERKLKEIIEQSDQQKKELLEARDKLKKIVEQSDQQQKELLETRDKLKEIVEQSDQQQKEAEESIVRWKNRTLACIIIIIAIIICGPIYWGDKAQELQVKEDRLMKELQAKEDRLTKEIQMKEDNLLKGFEQNFEKQKQDWKPLLENQQQICNQQLKNQQEGCKRREEKHSKEMSSKNQKIDDFQRKEKDYIMIIDELDDKVEQTKFTAIIVILVVIIGIMSCAPRIYQGQSNSRQNLQIENREEESGCFVARKGRHY